MRDLDYVVRALALASMSSATPTLFRRIRAALEEKISLAELATFADEFAQAADDEAAVEIEEELQAIHRDVGHDLSPRETQVFLAVLYHLRAVLPTASVITLWFDLILRPALREPNLPLPATEHASDLVVLALEPDVDDGAEQQESMVSAFRRRLVDLYLLDAFNDASGDDVIAKAELDKVDREKRDRWKSNLENLLLKHGIKHPEARSDRLLIMSLTLGF